MFKGGIWNEHRHNAGHPDMEFRARRFLPHRSHLDCGNVGGLEKAKASARSILSSILTTRRFESRLIVPQSRIDIRVIPNFLVGVEGLHLWNTDLF